MIKIPYATSYLESVSPQSPNARVKAIRQYLHNNVAAESDCSETSTVVGGKGYNVRFSDELTGKYWIIRDNEIDGFEITVVPEELETFIRLKFIGADIGPYWIYSAEE